MTRYDRPGDPERGPRDGESRPRQERTDQFFKTVVFSAAKVFPRYPPARAVV
jgi:hypothetical protein